MYEAENDRADPCSGTGIKCAVRMRMQYIPLFLYSFRWNIEVSCYEQKSFWSN